MQQRAPALLAAADAVEAQMSEMVSEIVQELHDLVPGLPSDPRSRAGTWRVIEEGMMAMLALMRAAAVEDTRGAEPPSPPWRDLDASLPILARAIRVLARADRPVSAVVRGEQLAHRRFLGRWNLALAQTGVDTDELIVLTRDSRRLSFTWSDAITQRLIARFQAETDRLADSGESRRLAAIAALMAHDTRVDLDRLGRELGYTLTQHHLGLVLWGGPAHEPSSPVLASLVRTLAAALGADREPLVVPLTPSLTQGWISLGATPGPVAAEALRSVALPPGVSVALGGPAHGGPGFRRAQLEADAAYRLAVRTGRSVGTLVTYGEVRQAAVLAGDPERLERFVMRHLGPLAVDSAEAGRLRGTLLAFLDENHSRQATAERLGIHPNTVGNRVHACQEILGEDLGGSPAEVHIALAALATLGSSLLAPSLAEAPGVGTRAGAA